MLVILNKVIGMIQIIKIITIFEFMYGFKVFYYNISNLMNKAVQLILNVKAFECSRKKNCDH